MPRIFELRTFLQSQNGWKYGISLDENVKTHPLIRPFKTLTEKVGNSPLVALSGHADCPYLRILSGGQRNSGHIHSQVYINSSETHQWARPSRTDFQEPILTFCSLALSTHRMEKHCLALGG